MGADPQEMYIGLMNCDFNVSVDLFMTPTIMATSDVVLPAATFPERNGLRLGDGVQRGEVINKVCSVGECKSDMEINLMLGKRFNPEAWPWENVDEMFGAMLKAQTPTTSLRRCASTARCTCRSATGATDQPHCARTASPASTRRPAASSCGRRSTTTPAWTRCPTFRGRPRPSLHARAARRVPARAHDRRPPVVAVPLEHRQVPRMRNLKEGQQRLPQPEDRQEYGLKNGEWVWVENVYSRCKAQVEVTNLCQDPRVIACDHAWWHPEGDAEGLYESHDLNVNNLLPGIPGRAGSGSNYKTTLVKLYKVTPEDDSNGYFPSPDSGYVSQAMDGKGVKAIEELVDERAQIMRDREALKKAVAEAQAEQASSERRTTRREGRAPERRAPGQEEVFHGDPKGTQLEDYG